LTDLFKIRTKKFVPLEMDVDVRDIVREVFDIFAIQIEEKGLEMSLLFDESLPPILRLDA
jgi:two-component system sensor histidine kinase/response regulator